MLQYHTVPRRFMGLQRQHFDGGKAGKAVPLGEGSKLHDDSLTSVWVMTTRYSSLGEHEVQPPHPPLSLLSLSLTHKTKVQRAGATTRVRTCRQAELAVN